MIVVKPMEISSEISIGFTTIMMNQFFLPSFDTYESSARGQRMYTAIFGDTENHLQKRIASRCIGSHVLGCSPSLSSPSSRTSQDAVQHVRD